MNKTVVAGVTGAALLVGALSACGSQPGYTNTEYVYVHGYYDSHHHYHSYSKPHKVSASYYNSHKNSYPKPYKTTKVKVKTKTTHKSVNTTPKRVSKGKSTYKKSGSYSYKRKH